MANPKKTKSSRSRDTSRARSTSRPRAPSKTRQASKSFGRKSVPVVSKSKSLTKTITPRRKTPVKTPKAESGPKSASPARQRSTRSSVRMIEKLETYPAKYERPSTRKSVSPPRPCFHISCLAKLPGKVLCSPFSNGSICFFAAFIIPLFVYWCIFLALSPTSEKSFTRTHSRFGKSLAFVGAALPYDPSLISSLVLVGVAAFTRLTILLHAIIPLGKTTTIIADGQRLHHKSNGIVVVMVYAVAVAIYHHKIADLIGGAHFHVLSDYLPTIFLAAVLEAFVYTVHVFLKEHFSRSTSRTNGSGCFVVDFYTGRETRPTPFGVDIKVLSQYICLVGGFILQVSFALRQYKEHASLSLGLMTLIFLHCVVLLDFFIYEPTSLHCHDVLRYGCGLRWFQSKFVIRPLLSSLGVFYLAQNYHVAYPSLKPLPDYTLPALGAIFFIFGLFVRRRAINQRFVFRCYPQHPDLETMSTFRAESGKRILAGGWWGFVRHPDYLGEVLLTVGLALPTGFGSFAPWIVPVFVFLDVLLRIHWDEQVCSEKYDSAWKKYTTVVPYRLIRGVY
ncbi:hypothetical protein ACTXT7_010230 [Hymenolepis weldensis]